MNVFESCRIKNRRNMKCVTIGKVTGYKIFHTLKFVTLNGEINLNEIMSVSNFALVSSKKNSESNDRKAGFVVEN